MILLIKLKLKSLVSFKYTCMKIMIYYDDYYYLYLLTLLIRPV